MSFFLIILLTNVLSAWILVPCLDTQHNIGNVALGKRLYIVTVAYLPLPSRRRQNIRENSALIQLLSFLFLWFILKIHLPHSYCFLQGKKNLL